VYACDVSLKACVVCLGLRLANGHSTHNCVRNTVISDNLAGNIGIRAVVLLGAACALNRVFAIG